MLERNVLRRVLLAPSSLRSSIVPAIRSDLRFQLSSRYSTSLPSVTKPSFWTSLVPKPLRRGASPAGAKIKKQQNKEWNPATFFIVIFLLIGSMSIQMIALRNEYDTFTRRAEARISLLKEIIDRVQRGEEVDVEGLLGTGDSKKEEEWEEILKDIEREDELWKSQKQKKPMKDAESTHQNIISLSNISAESTKDHESQPEPKRVGTRSNAPRGFY
ncbi:MAG: hypothetical protein M1818_006494 [Claussenomyces sp. TS43310]|nr:MAG: hypothetical protein M1818_006494 [Claussenomyces sp. TS43310]